MGRKSNPRPDAVRAADAQTLSWMSTSPLSARVTVRRRGSWSAAGSTAEGDGSATSRMSSAPEESRRPGPSSVRSGVSRRAGRRAKAPTATSRTDLLMTPLNLILRGSEETTLHAADWLPCVEIPRKPLA